MLNFKLEGNDCLISSIFEIPSIKKEYEIFFSKSKSTIYEEIKKYKDFVYSLYLGGNSDENLPSEKEIEKCLSDNDIITDFNRQIQRKLIDSAIYEVFYFNELNLKENIMRLLRSNFIEEEASKVVFDCILMRIHNIDLNDYVCVELMAHFFPCRKASFEFDFID